MTSGSLLYLISIFVTCSLSAFLAFYAWKHRQTPGSQAYSSLAFGQFLLALFEIMSVFSPSQDQALFWFQLRYTSAAWIAVFWLLFALEYSGHKNWLSQPIITGLMVIPLGTQALLWTNSRHHLWVVQEAGLSRIGSLWFVDLTARIPGPGFLVHFFFTVSLVLFGVALLLLTGWKQRRKFLGQALVLAGAGLTALVFTLNSLFHLLPPTIFNLFTPGIGLSVLLIGLAIYRFQFLKRSPAPVSAPRHDRLPAPERQSLALIVLLFLILFSGISATAHFSYINYERHFRIQVDEQLSVIADLKVSSLANWRAERIGDAEILQHNPTFAGLVQAYFKNPAQAAAEWQIQTWLDSLRNAYQYDRVFLLDPQGVERLASPKGPKPVAQHLIDDTADVLASGNFAFLDFHKSAVDNSTYLALVVPVYEDGDLKRPLAVLVLRMDPTTSLYPSLSQWPTPSQTAETLLVRRDGEQVLFLTPTRFQPDAALKLRIPLTVKDVLAVKAVLGERGTVEGIDYRGISVIGNVRAIPDSPWFLVAHMDTSEAFAPLRERQWRTLLFYVTLLVGLVVSLLLFWRQNRVRYYQGQVKTFEALRVSEDKFRLAFETSPDSVSISRLKDGLYVSVNQGFEQTFGYCAAELVGKTSLDLAVWEEPEKRKEFVAALQATGKVENFVARFRIKSGDLRYGQLSGALIRLNGEPHLLNITRDITERVEMKLAMQEYNARLETEVAQRTHQLGLIQEKLLRQERLATLGQVAGSVAHELRNPLGVISNAVYFLNLITPQTEPRVQEYLTIIEQETRYAEKVVSDLLDQSRIKLPDRSQISVTELVQQALDRNPLSPHIRLTLDISAELPPVYVDPVQIVQVLGNLLSNAYQAMPDGGGLTIAARQNGQEVAIKVIDQGEGIAAEYMPRMFEPLFTTKQKGIGLGLSLSKNLVESNDGRIDVFSQTGQGSTFVVFLPVVGSIQEKKPYE